MTTTSPAATCASRAASASSSSRTGRIPTRSALYRGESPPALAPADSVPGTVPLAIAARTVLVVEDRIRGIRLGDELRASPLRERGPVASMSRVADPERADQATAGHEGCGDQHRDVKATHRRRAAR